MTVLVVRIDINFRTLFGKFVGGLCALSGIFILTLPIPIVVNSFGNFYKNRLWRSEVELKRRERMRLRSSEMREVEKQQLIEENGMQGLVVVLKTTLQVMAKTIDVGSNK